jgi:hypothetical protein
MLPRALFAFTVSAAALAATQTQAELVSFELRGHMVGALPPDFQIGDKFVATYTFESTVSGTPIFGSNNVQVQYVNIASWVFNFESGYRFDSSLPTTSEYIGSIELTDNNFQQDPTGRDIYQATFSALASVGTPLPSGRSLSLIGIDLEDYSPGGNPDMLASQLLPLTPPPASAIDSAFGRLLYEGLGTPDQPFFKIDSTQVVPEPSSFALLAVGGIFVQRARCRLN